MAFQQGFPGVTPPVSLNEPTETELKQSETLTQFLDAQHWYEELSDIEHRKQYISELEGAVKKWVVAEAKAILPGKLSGEDIARFGVRVLPFGGLAFEVAAKGSDIDAVCLLPNFVDRQRLFDSLPHTLQTECSVHNLRKVAEAYVPVISFEYKALKIDLIFAVLRYKFISDDVDFTNDDIFVNMDELSVRSLSGVRDVMTVLNHVPHQDNFRNTLKIIKAWAKSKSIHSSAMGYPGGIAWTIMVARTCQMYPHATVSALVQHVFSVMSTWPWPKPVILRELLRSDLGLEQFNSSRMRHIMPILTPAYPEHNCAYTVCQSTRDVVQNQMQDACKVCEKIKNGEENWSALFQPVQFFDLYKHFIMVTSHAASTQEHIDWSGFLESQVRKLVMGLENVPEIKRLHFYTKSYDCRERFQCTWFIGLKLQKKDGKTQSFDITPAVQSFKKIAYDMGRDRNFVSETTTLDIQHIPKKQIANVLSSME